MIGCRKPGFITHAAVMAMSPKSNLPRPRQKMKDVETKRTGDSMHLRNALSRVWRPGYGKGYKHAHDYPQYSYYEHSMNGRHYTRPTPTVMKSGLKNGSKEHSFGAG